MKCFIYWTADLKSSKLWSSQLWTQFKQLRRGAWKSQDFNGVWTGDLTIPVRRSNQLSSYEATDVGSWSFVSSHKWPAPNVSGFIAQLERRTGIARSRVQTPLKSWLFQASLRNCLNCVHNCCWAAHYSERYRDSKTTSNTPPQLISLVFRVCFKLHQLLFLPLILTATNSAPISSTSSFTHLFIPRSCRSIGLWIILEYY